MEISIRDGVTAWLDLVTRYGRVHNGLEDADRPEPGTDTVEVRARSSFGDITVHRSLVADTESASPLVSVSAETSP